MRNTRLIDIRDIIGRNGFDPINEFIKEDLDDGSISLVFKREPRLTFYVEENPHSHHTFRYTYSKFEKNFPRTRLQPDFNVTFPKLLDAIELWLRETVKDYVNDADTEDPWAVHQFLPPAEIVSKIQSFDFESDEKFLPNEQKLVTETLQKAKEFARREIPMSFESLEELDRKMDLVIEAVTTMGKKTWRNHAWEILSGLTISLATDPDTFTKLGGLFTYVMSLTFPQMGPIPQLGN